jgi:hypothetical protein
MAATQNDEYRLYENDEYGPVWLLRSHTTWRRRLCRDDSCVLHGMAVVDERDYRGACGRRLQ